MEMIIIVIVLLIVLICVGLFTFIYIEKKVSNFSERYFGTKDIKEAIEKSEIEEANTPRSISSMEPVALPYIKKDFPNLNINEIKSKAEKAIVDYLTIISTKDKEKYKKYNGKIRTLIDAKIASNKEQNVKYTNVKIHRTAVSKYENKNGIATIYLVTALEYEKNGKKIQDRMKTELIYIVDKSKVGEEVEALGINCPNCGAPVTTLGNKTCLYCGTAIIDIVDKSWVINNIYQG